MVGMATLCAVLLTGCSGSDPSDSVMELVKNGDIEQAQQIYAEKISGKEEYESSFAEKFIPYLENLIESYNNGELSEEKINDDFETYKEMLGENVTFKDVESQLSALEISKHCFETAEKLRWEGELTQAYRMYARVIKKDRCYETAQQYITQIPADYLSESEDLFEGGQYQEAVRQSILGYALLDDKSGFDEIAIKVTKRLAEDYGFDNAAVLVEADKYNMKTHWPFGGFFLKLSDEKNGTHEYEDYLKECEEEKQLPEEELEFHCSKDPKKMTMQESQEEIGKFLRWNKMTPEERRAELEAQKAATCDTEQAAGDMPCAIEPESAPDTPQGTVLDEAVDIENYDVKDLDAAYAKRLLNELESLLDKLGWAKE